MRLVKALAVEGLMALAFAAGVLSPTCDARASTCESWRQICLGRTQGDEGFCGPKVEECRRTGCFTEGAQYGGRTHCGLKPGAARSSDRAPPEAPVHGCHRGNGGNGARMICD